MAFAAWLVAMVGPVLARILAALGLSLVTLTGLTTAVAGFKSTFMGMVGSLPGDAVQLAGLYGVWEACGMVLGCLTFVITWQSTAGFWKLAKS